jgi:hypothetical protein
VRPRPSPGANPWTVLDSDTPARSFDRHEREHEAVIGEKLSLLPGDPGGSGVRRLIRESWQRSLRLRLDPLTAQAEPALNGHDVTELRAAHPLNAVLPVFERLLVRHAAEAGLIVAVADASGRLLWIDGDSRVRSRAEEMCFVVGADWSETRVGTSAPGTALALNHGIQIQRAEHFSQLAHRFSCTAVPIRHPVTGVVLGVLDITGGDGAVAAHTLPLLDAAVAAAEAELRIQSLRPAARAVGRPTGPRSHAPYLGVLGTEHGSLREGRHSPVSSPLSPRHAEILLLLSWHREGLSAERLAHLLSDDSTNGGRKRVDHLRAEMVRLRRVLATSPADVGIGSRPYRLDSTLETDAGRVLALLGRGAHRMALAEYPGPVLPGSTSPGVAEIRAEVSARLRQTLLSDGAVDVLLDYARTDEAHWDREVWLACLQLLPPRSPQRAPVISRLSRLEG